MGLQEKLSQLPNSPGVYVMKDAGGAVIYVGKARNLRQRVRTYFSQSGDSRWHVRFLVARIADLDIILTDTEKEALLLENTLIKQHRPRYNLDLKDDKTYFSLRVDLQEQYPRFSIVRKISRDGARYFGPYSSASAARDVLRHLTRMFPLRHYPLSACMSRKRPCLYHQIGQCSAPCHGLISAEEYAELLKGAMLFLEGKGKDLVARFKRCMQEASEQMRYEEAARWRNLLRSIEQTVEKQKVVLQGGDCDVIGFCREGSQLELAQLFIRGGLVNGSRLYNLEWELDDAEGVASFIRQHYSEATFIPDEILVPLPLEDGEPLGELLSDIRGRKVIISCPRRGTKRELVELAGKNAVSALRARAERRISSEAVLEELRTRLQLAHTPHRIECYDISTIQGRFSVGSGVAFSEGVPDKERYRRYRIRTVQGQDDFAMLKEVFTRRFSAEKIEQEGVPDLVVVDGGIGQLNAVQEIVVELGLAGRFDLVSLAKSRTGRAMRSSEVDKSAERVFLPGRRNPVVLKQNSRALLLLAAIRDEAHRFAIGYHRTLRGKEGVSSGIMELPGIGGKRGAALLRQFGSLQGVREASVEQLAEVPGMNRAAAEKLYAALHSGEVR